MLRLRSRRERRFPNRSGGSANAENAPELSNFPDGDGFLVGDASLKPEIAEIVTARAEKHASTRVEADSSTRRCLDVREAAVHAGQGNLHREEHVRPRRRVSRDSRELAAACSVGRSA